MTTQLERDDVKDAMNAADENINKMAEALKQISLKSTFGSAVEKSGKLEDNLREINVTSLGTAQKTALGVGKRVLISVDVPGIVKPNLEEAFDGVLKPLVNIVDQIQQEVYGVRAQVKSFEPEKLLEQFLQPHISKFVKELDQYRPSKLLKFIKDLYEKILKNLHKLDPGQLVVKLEGLYQQIAKMAQVLSPKGLISLLERQKNNIQNNLKELPNKLIGLIESALGGVDKIFSGLGLDELIDSSFWTDLKELVDFNLDKSIENIDNAQKSVSDQVDGINEEKINNELNNLRASLETFSKDEKAPAANYDVAKKALEDSWGNYSEALDTLKQEKFEGLEPNFEPVFKTDYYYQCLVERLGELYNRLVNPEIASKLEEPYNIEAQYTAWKQKADQDRRTTEGSRLRPNKEDLQTIRKSLPENNELIKAFKDTLPNQLEAQFIGPIRDILTSLNEILKQPKEIVERIEEVIEALADAPGKITKILLDQAKNLKSDFDKTAGDLSGEIGKVVDNILLTLSSTYTAVEETLQSLSPTILLNTFYASDFKADGLQFLLQKLKAESRDPITDLLWGKLDANQRLLLAGNGLKEEAIVVALNELLTTDTLYSASNFRGIELPDHGKELAEKFSSLSEDQRLRLNRIALETVYGDALVLSVQSIFPFFMKTLKDLYPEAVIQELDQTHAKIVEVVRNLPKNVAEAVQNAYKALMAKFEELIGDRLDRIFLELKKPLWRLQRDLDIGLEDISGSYRRLLSAVPV